MREVERRRTPALRVWERALASTSENADVCQSARVPVGLFATEVLERRRKSGLPTDYEASLPVSTEEGTVKTIQVG